MPSQRDALTRLIDAELEWFERTGIRRLIPGGARLIHQHEALGQLFVVLGGQLAVKGAQGVELAYVGRGEVLGEVSFLDGGMPSAEVVASDDAVVLAIPRPALHQRLLTDHDFATRFYRAMALVLAQRLRRMGQRKVEPLPS